MAMISFIIDDADMPEFKEKFILACPNETLETDSPLSDGDWVKEKIRQFAYNVYKKGKEISWKQTNKPTFDENIVTAA